MTFRLTLLVLLLPLTVLSCARSTVVLRDDQALALIEAEEELIIPGRYTYDEIRNRIGGKLVVAIFNRQVASAGSGNFDWVRKDNNIGAENLLETWNVVLLGTSGGKKGEEPKAENLKEIGEASLMPAVISDLENRIRAVVYLPPSLGVVAFARPDGSIRLELGERRRNRGDISYSFQLK